MKAYYLQCVYFTLVPIQLLDILNSPAHFSTVTISAMFKHFESLSPLFLKWLQLCPAVSKLFEC